MQVRPLKKCRSAAVRFAGVAAAGAAFMLFSVPQAVAGTATPATGTGPQAYHRDHDDDRFAYLGNAAMAPGSEFYLNGVASNIVGMVASARYPGVATVTASGTICTQHVAGTADTVLVQVLVDNAPVADGFQQYAIPASQPDGSVCSPFSITAKVVPLNALGHSVWLSGQASGAPSYVTGAAISAIMRQ